MSGIIYDGEGPKTQCVEAVKALIAYHHHGSEPQEMPDFYRLSRDMILVLSNKKDGYYVTTAKACSCPAATYRGGPCKHMRKFFPQPKKSLAALEQESDAELARLHGPKRLARPPEDECAIQLSGFRPVPEEA